MLSISNDFQGLTMLCSIVLAMVGIILIIALDRVSDPYQEDSQLADYIAFGLGVLFISLFVILILLACL